MFYTLIFIIKASLIYALLNHIDSLYIWNFVLVFSAARGRGRGRSRNEDDEDGAGGRPSGPSTLFDFLESKMGVLSIDGVGPLLRLILHLKLVFSLPYLSLVCFLRAKESATTETPRE